MLWVIPCRYDPVVFECVDSIRTHFPGDDILLVDSCSPDTSYLDTIDVDHIETGNRHRHSGAWKRAVDYGADRYGLIHDSLIVHSHWEPADFQAVRWFHESGLPIAAAGWVTDQLATLGYAVPDYYAGIFGPMLFCTGDVLDHFAGSGVLDLQPSDVEEAAGMERVTGIVAAELGYDVTIGALQGQMAGFYDSYDHTHVEKRHLARP